MVTQITSSPSINKPQASAPKVTRASIFYVNDEHENIPNMEKLKTASDQFDSFTPSTQVDKLKFSAGDIGVGRDAVFSKLGVVFQNSTGIMASAGGNHEFDLNKKDLGIILKDANYKILAQNVEIPQDKAENKELSNRLTKSYTQEINGTKYGVIGLLPYDFKYHLSDAHEYRDFEITPLEKNIPQIQKEVDNFKQQGIDKIIILSHAGYESDVKIAQNVEGIDVILGGHTHNLIEGIQEGKNLFYSKKTGEPTIITQAGKDGKYFGILNLEFNDKGVITKAQNNVNKTNEYSKSLIMENLINSVIGKPNVIGTIKSAPKHEHTLTSENPSVNFLADAERSELGVDLALINAGNIRASLEPGTLTDRDLQVMTPFKNKVCIIKMSEKEVVDALNVGAKSFTDTDKMPGILQISGIKYTVSKSEGTVKEASFVAPDGSETPINVKNPNPFKTYRVAADDFIAKGGNEYMPNKWKDAEAKFDFDKDKLVKSYVQKLGKPVEISNEQRIKIVD